MSHKQKDKGDLAVAKISADLTEKGYSVFVPAFTEHLPFDIIIYREGILNRIQCKYSIDGQIENRTSWTDKHGSHKKYYTKEDFDYFGMYLPTIGVCCYPSISFAGRKIRPDVPGKTNKHGYLFWSDFQDLTTSANPRFIRKN